MLLISCKQKLKLDMLSLRVQQNQTMEKMIQELYIEKLGISLVMVHINPNSEAGSILSVCQMTVKETIELSVTQLKIMMHD